MREDVNNDNFLIFSKAIEEKLQLHQVPVLLSFYLNFQEYQAILTFFKNQLDRFKVLSWGHAIAMKKCLSGEDNLPRSCSILRTSSGEFQLIVDTKSKIAGGEKIFSTYSSKGVFKKGKPSWRIDSVTEKRMMGLRSRNFISLEKKDDALDSAIKESTITQQLDPKKCVHTFWGGLLTRYNDCYYKLYSEYAYFGDLHTFLSTAYLSDQDKNQLKMSLLESIAECHQKKIIHGDISSKNILVYKEGNNKYTLKLSDFGSCTRVEETGKLAQSSKCYASPEILYAYLNPNSEIRNSIRDDLFDKYNILCKFYIQGENERIYDYIILDRDVDETQQLEYMQPHLANDVWACGVVFYEIEHDGRLPHQALHAGGLHVTELTKKMLEPDRDQRPGIEEILQMMQEQQNKKECLINNVYSF